MGSARADVIIDDFKSGPEALTNPNAGATVAGGATAPSAIGGARVISITNASSVVTPSTLTVTPSLGRLDFTSQTAPPPNPTTFGLLYDGSSNPTTFNPTGLGGMNILAAGGTGVNVIGNNSSNAPELVTITFYTDATHASTATLVIPSGAANTLVFAPFSAFTTVAGDSAANFASLGALTASISYSNSQGSSGAITLLSFATVPEPSSIALGSLAVVGVLGLGRVRGRRPS